MCLVPHHIYQRDCEIYEVEFQYEMTAVKAELIQFLLLETPSLNLHLTGRHPGLGKENDRILIQYESSCSMNYLTSRPECVYYRKALLRETKSR